MSRGRHATPVKLANKERQELLSLIERKTAAQRDVMRARIALQSRVTLDGPQLTEDERRVMTAI